MKTSEEQAVALKPTDVAREAFRLLAARRIPPTPQAYGEIYNQIAGIPAVAVQAAPIVEASVTSDGPTRGILTGFASNLSALTGEAGELGRRLQRAAETSNWQEYSQALTQLIERHLKRSAAFEAPVPSLPEGGQTKLLRDLLSRTLTFTIASLLEDAPELAAEAERLGTALKTAYSDADLHGVSVSLKQLCYKIEIKTGDLAEQQELLYRLFRLLLENISELLDEDSWMQGQIAVVQNLISNPMDARLLEDAMRSLKDVVYKQGILKNSLADAKNSVKSMMLSFIDRLSIVAASTGQYHERIGAFSSKISSAKSVAELNGVVEEMLRETRVLQAQALDARDQMMAARQQVQEAETRITELESKLKEMSELVREDQLTGSLNRRGLDDVFEREAARADRRGSPLCVAMLDLDNFKRLNDNLGHVAGDGALVHLVKVVKETLRTMDAIARFGGEEFLILFPETSLDEATQALVRLQRNLTRHFFMHNNERVLITFSAGVALRARGEDQTAVVARADKALYQAKMAGKNRVMAAG